jgi:hypothetical protein
MGSGRSPDPGSSAKGRVDSSSSARLGAVREGSRQLRPPEFLPDDLGGACVRLSFRPARPRSAVRCRRPRVRRRASPTVQRQRLPGSGRVLPWRRISSPGRPYRFRRDPAGCGWPTGQDRAVVAAARPRRPCRSRGVVRLGGYRAEDRLRADLPPAGDLALPAPGHDDHPPGRRRGIRGVCAAGLAGQRARGQRPDAPVREMVCELLLRARHGRAGHLSSARASRYGTRAVGDHHDCVVPAGAGAGHGDRACPHAARRCSGRVRRAGGPNGRTSEAVSSLATGGLSRSGPGRGRQPWVRTVVSEHDVPAPASRPTAAGCGPGGSLLRPRSGRSCR